MTAPVHVAMVPEGDAVVVRLVSYMGPQFAAFRAACAGAGARYRPATKDNVVPLAGVPDLLVTLDRAGIGFACEPEVARALAARASEMHALADAGAARVEAAEARLAPSGLRLFPFQRAGVRWLAPRQNAVLADQMGLGKTVQLLVALPDAARAVVVVPAAVRYNWVREVGRWRPDLRATVVASAATFRWPEAGEVLLVTYGNLPGELVDGEDGEKTVEVDLPPAPDGVVLAADEAHALKSSKAQRTAKFRALADRVRASAGRVWLVTGTPLLNRPPELWSLLQTAGCAKTAFGSWAGFCGAFNGRKGRFGYDWGRPRADVPDLLRKVMLVRRREEVLPDLPKKHRTEVEVNGLDAETTAACDAVVAALGARGKGVDDVADLHWGEVEFELISKARAALAAAKTPALLELVAEYEESETPVVVFSAHRVPVDALAAREGWAAITGETPADERGRIVERFQAGELKGVAGTIPAMGVGVTLTRAHHLLFADLDWTPALNSQAEDRCCRIGQDADKVQVVRLVTRHPLDRRVLELLTLKQEVIEASVDASAVAADHVGQDVVAEAGRGAELAAAAPDARAERERLEAEAARVAEVRRQAVAKLLAGESVATTDPAGTSGSRRLPKDATEEWAARGLVLVAGLDPDHAGILNGVGFSRLDNEFGHSLARQVADGAMLSEKQWAAAVKLARRYARQIGPEPARNGV